jgi:hypothetical protein
MAVVFGTPQAQRPCKTCDGRHVGCHGNCEREAAWLEEHKEKLDTIYAARNREMEIDSFRLAQVRKTKKKKRKR